MSGLVIRGGGFEARSDAEYGFTVLPGGLVGWFDPVGARRASSGGQAGQHGAPDSQVYLDSRVTSVRGKAWARSAAELNDYGSLLAGVGADGQRFQLEVEHAGQTLWAWARRGSTPRFDPRPEALYAEYEFDFWLPRPWKFGDVQVSESQHTGGQPTIDSFAHHRGNTRAWSVFTVTGQDPAGYRIVHPGGSYRVTRALAAGDVDEIDFRAGTYSKNGTRLSTYIQAADRFQVRGGARMPWRAEAITPGATVSAVAHTTDTYV